MPDTLLDDVPILFSDPGLDFRLPDRGPVFDSAQRQYLQSAFPSFDHLVTVRQMHGDDILVLKKGAAIPEEPATADALITEMPGLALSIRTADCLPVFVCDQQTRGIGLIHAGWQGIRRALIMKTVQAMQYYFGSRGEDLRAVFGPCIRSCCYAVGREFKQYFPREVENRDGQLYFDLAQAARQQLIDMGVREANILDDGICTCCQTEYFSYRRQGEGAGRHLSLIMRRSY